MNDILFVIGISILVMAVSVISMLLIRKVVGFSVLEKHNDVAGFIYAVIGVIYAVLLAFVVIVEWETYRDTQAVVQKEVRCMASIFRDVRLLGSPDKLAVQREIVNYSTIVINEEWPMMKQGRSSSKALNSVHRIFALVGVDAENGKNSTLRKLVCEMRN